MNTLFQGLFDNGLTPSISVGQFLLCILVSLAIGIYLAVIYTFKNRYTQSFILTLAMIPAVVCVVIMMVNGNVGAGVAVAGAFSLVRFRSAPGTAKEICAIFLAMGAGIITGMGYLAYGVLFAVILGGIMFLYNAVGMGIRRKPFAEKTLVINIPENLDYEGVFQEIMDKYTSRSEWIAVKTTNMGSLFKLTYQVTMKESVSEKEFLDKLRCRNGNLEISLTKRDDTQLEL